MADFGFSDPNDNPPDNFYRVEITTLPNQGTLTLDGTPVAAGQFVTVTDITAGKLTFEPAVNSNGIGYATFTFQVQDDGGTANGGSDLDPTPNTMTVNVTSVNDAPAGTDTTVTTLEDTAYTFTVADFGFTDPNDNPPNNFFSVEITTLPTQGALELDGAPVTADQFVSVTDITAGKLAYNPAANGNGNPYASFTFQVQDDGGTANGGVDFDPTPNTVSIDVTSVNDPPAGADKTVTTTKGSPYTFMVADFGFSDPNDNPPNNFVRVEITTLPTQGTLELDGTAVTAGQFVDVTDIAAGKLTFDPGAADIGSPFASFTFQVQDDGGTANGGSDLDPTPNTLTVDVTLFNHAPAGTDGTVTALEDTTYTFAVADFGFTDPNDNPPNNFYQVEITTLPNQGTLNLDGTPVTAGQFVPVTKITAGKLTFDAAANANGSPYASFTFQVQDDGGTANGGSDLDPTANTLTVNVTSVNDAPAGTDTTLTITKGSPYTFTVADFGFTDPNDNPPNNFYRVEITTLPDQGTLELDGTAVTAGQFIDVTDVAAGNLTFDPGTAGVGSPFTSFTFQVQDDGGTANGGVDLDPTPNTLTINVIRVNHAPAGTDATVTALEDTAYTFTAADFGFTDPNDNPPDNFYRVEITTLPAQGTLELDGTPVTAGQFINVTDITANKLTFSAAANANGSPYTSFTFQVQDDGGTANGGADLDPTPNTISVNVTSVNDAPMGTDKTVSTMHGAPYTFTVADFGFSDPNDNPPNNFYRVEITTLPNQGTLKLNGTAVTAGQFVNVTDIVANKLTFDPGASGEGNSYASFTFQVQDDGGTNNGGVDLDPTPNTMTINVGGNASIVGFVYCDNDGDGKYTGNATIPHVTITLQYQDATGGWLNWTTSPYQQTNDAGWYGFAGLPAGTYRVIETQPVVFMEGGTNTIVVTLAASTQKVANFGVGGLLPQYISRRLFLSSTPKMSQIVRDLNLPPVVDLNGAAAGNDLTTKFFAGGGPITIAPAGTISDVDSPTLVALSVTITNPFDGPAEVLDATVTGTSISKSYANGVLTLTGVAPVADYTTVLRSITFNNTSATPDAADNRIVTFVAFDGMAYSTVATATISDPPAPSSSTQLASSPTAGVSLQQNVPAASSAAPATPSAAVVENAQAPTTAASAAAADLAQNIPAASPTAPAVVQSAPVENAPETTTEPAVPSVVRNGSEVVVTGTAGDDTLQFVAGAAENTVIVSGQSYTFPAGEVTAFHFLGGGGNDSATLTASGLASLAETAQLQPGSATLQGVGYTVDVSNVPNIQIDGRGEGVQAVLFDSPGDDSLTAEGDVASLSGDGFVEKVSGFKQVRASGVAGGLNTLRESAFDFLLEKVGSWVEEID